jgi:hypothetical protein
LACSECTRTPRGAETIRYIFPTVLNNIRRGTRAQCARNKDVASRKEHRMKKYAYTLVTSPQRNSGSERSARVERTLTLRETLVIENGPSYSREYIVATDGFGLTAHREALQPG